MIEDIGSSRAFHTKASVTTFIRIQRHILIADGRYSYSAHGSLPSNYDGQTPDSLIIFHFQLKKQ